MGVAEHGSGARLGYKPGLDVVRGGAVLAVVAGHSGVLPMRCASIGVAVFFTLSGFLITKLMLEEQDRAGGVDVTNFYVRRLRRLIPALLPALAFMAMVDLLSGRNPVGDVVAAITYTTNFYQLLTDVERGAFSHLWSLAVEEHFYLCWPLVVGAVRRRHLAGVCAATCLAVVAARWMVDLDGSWLYRGTIFRIDGLLAGALLACGVHSGKVRCRQSLLWAGAASLCVIAALPDSEIVHLLTLAAATYITVGALDMRFSPRPLVHVGVISYGIYLWHFPFARLAWDHGLPPTLEVICVWGGGLLAAEVSWRLVERRWLSSSDERRRGMHAGRRSSRTGRLGTTRVRAHTTSDSLEPRVS